MKVDQIFLAEINFLGKIDSLIDKIEGFDIDDTVKSAATSAFSKKGQGEQDKKGIDVEELSQEGKTLNDLYKIIKSKKPMRIGGVVIDIFTAVVVMIILQRLSPMKREILMSLPIKQVLKYAIKNIDKVFTKF